MAGLGRIGAKNLRTRLRVDSPAKKSASAARSAVPAAGSWWPRGRDLFLLGSIHGPSMLSGC